MSSNTAPVANTDVIGADPLARLLVKIKPLHFALGVLFFHVLYVIALPLMFGVYSPRAGLERSASVDYANQLSFWFIYPVVAYFFVWQPSAVARLYKSALAVILGDENLHEAFRLHKRPVWVFGLLMGLLVVYLGIVANLQTFGRIWYNANGLMLAILQTSRFLFFYMVTVIVARHLVVSATLNRLYSKMPFPVIVARTYFSAFFLGVSNYALSFSAVGAVTGLYLAVRPLISTPPMPEYAIFLVLYFILMPFSFFLPFLHAHRKMQASKDLALSQLSEFLQAEYELLMRGINGNVEPLSSGRIEAIRAALSLTESAPTWPFEMSSVYRLFGTIILPFALPAISYAVDLFSLFR